MAILRLSVILVIFIIVFIMVGFFWLRFFGLSYNFSQSQLKESRKTDQQVPRLERGVSGTITQLDQNGLTIQYSDGQQNQLVFVQPRVYVAFRNSPGEKHYISDLKVGQQIEYQSELAPLDSQGRARILRIIVEQ